MHNFKKFENSDCVFKLLCNFQFQIGGTHMKPVILSPQIVIGAIGKIQKVPRFGKGDSVIAVNLLSISWSADHRVVDGVTMAKFSNQWKHFVENPLLLALGV